MNQRPLDARPLTEVVAQNHSFADLSAELDPGPTLITVAAERVLRGEVPSIGGPDELLRIGTGDPPADQLDVEHMLISDGEAADGARCLIDAVRHWTAQSERSVRASGVGGSHIDALRELGLAEVRWRPATLQEVGALPAWALDASDVALDDQP